MFPRATATGVENPVSDFIHIEQLEVFAQRQLGGKKIRDVRFRVGRVYYPKGERESAFRAKSIE